MLRGGEHRPHQRGLGVEVAGGDQLVAVEHGLRIIEAAPLQRSKMLLEPVEARLPRSLLLADPTDQFLHALGIQPGTVAADRRPAAGSIRSPERKTATLGD